ncbi:hypothetical protein [Sphingosinicella sp.]|uniref:hypothetical protein n=1 Tax=Sphingosinicella sp. TaxID=1917971 RepID=UPI004037E57E
MLLVFHQELDLHNLRFSATHLRQKGSFLNEAEIGYASSMPRIAATVAAKRSVLESIGFHDASRETLAMLEIKLKDGNRFSFRSSAAVQDRMWDRAVITFKIALTMSETAVACTALAIVDQRAEKLK